MIQTQEEKAAYMQRQRELEEYEEEMLRQHAAHQAAR